MSDQAEDVEPAELPAVMDLTEFHRDGYLQEVNRRVLHPLGLALYAMVEKDGTVSSIGVYDDRADPEGWCFTLGGAGLEEQRDRFLANFGTVTARWVERAPARLEALGYMVQPPENAIVATPDDPKNQ